MNSQATTAAAGASTVSCSGGESQAALQPLSVADFNAMSPSELLARTKRGVENFDRRVFWLTESQLNTAFLPDAGVGRWPARVLLGHLADAELANLHRLRRIVGEDQPLLSEWDENSFIDANVYGHRVEDNGGRPAASIGGYVALIHTVRQFMAEWLGTLAPEAWTRVAMHPSRGELSLKDIVVYNAWHLEHHARFLRAKIDRMLGPDQGESAAGRPATAGAKAAGSCGSGCGCAGTR